MLEGGIKRKIYDKERGLAIRYLQIPILSMSKTPAVEE